MATKNNIKHSKSLILSKLDTLGISYLDFDYKNLHQKIEYNCPQCKTLKSGKLTHILSGHILCKKCSGKSKRTQEEAEQELNSMGIKFEPFIYTNNETKITTQCDVCGSWKCSRYADVIKGVLSCAKCGLKKTAQNQTLTQKDAENKLLALGLKYHPFTYDKSKTTDITIQCTHCGDYFTTLFDYLSNGGSTLCVRCKKSTSSQENELKDYVKSLGLSIQENIKMGGVELDIYIPTLKIGFEYNGNYWHSDFYKDKNFHYNKVTHFQNMGVRLIMINEYEWVNNNQEIKSYIKAQLNLVDQSIYARNCEVREITYKDVSPLLNYHQQKQTKASKYFGLYHKDELVLAMLLQKPQSKLGVWRNKEMLDAWDIKREICKEGVVVVGGKSKVFRFFVKKYQPKKVISYVDRAKFTGKSYQIMGFTLVKILPARYDWIIGDKFKKRSPKIYRDMIELYRNKKVLRFWDSGRYKFVWEKDKCDAISLSH